MLHVCRGCETLNWLAWSQLSKDRVWAGQQLNCNCQEYPLGALMEQAVAIYCTGNVPDRGLVPRQPPRTEPTLLSNLSAASDLYIATYMSLHPTSRPRRALWDH